MTTKEDHKAAIKAIREAKESKEEYHFERLFRLIGIVCAGISITVSLCDLYYYVAPKSFTAANGAPVTVSYPQFVQNSSNPIASFAPFFWALTSVFTGFLCILGELGFESILHHFELLRKPIGKGTFCIFLATFFVSSEAGSFLWILNVIVLLLGICSILQGIFLKKKSHDHAIVAPATTTSD